MAEFERLGRLPSGTLVYGDTRAGYRLLRFAWHVSAGLAHDPAIVGAADVMSEDIARQAHEMAAGRLVVVAGTSEPDHAYGARKACVWGVAKPKLRRVKTDG